MLRSKVCQGVKCVDKQSEFGSKVFQGAKCSSALKQSWYDKRKINKITNKGLCGAKMTCRMFYIYVVQKCR